MQRVAVIGASNNPERYSNKAMRMLIEYGHTAIPVTPTDVEVEGLKAFARPGEIGSPIDTVSLYVGPARQADLIDEIVGLKPRRVIFNPGTENPEAEQRCRAAGIEVVEACTLVLLKTRQF